MFAEEQSDVQEFFLYLLEELAKEVESFAPSVEAVPIEDEDAWSEIGSGGRKVIIHEAIVKQNIVFSLIVKFGCLALVAFGIANMWAAIFADVGVMVLAVLNAIRALKYKD